MIRRAALASIAFLLAGGAPALAFDDWVVFDTSPWWATRTAIYSLENRIALLQANPEIDDGYKGPLITGARARVSKLRATLPPAEWPWLSPCCYARRPIHIR
jgi:hypothetical protein